MKRVCSGVTKVVAMQEHPDVVEACACVLVGASMLESVLALLVTLKHLTSSRMRAQQPVTPVAQPDTNRPATHEIHHFFGSRHPEIDVRDGPLHHPPASLVPPLLEGELRNLLQQCKQYPGLDCPQPAVIGLTTSIPLTTSGKVDRGAVQRLCDDLLCRRQLALQPPVSGGASNMHDARKQLTLRVPQASQTMLQQADITRGSLEDSGSPTGKVDRGAVHRLCDDLLCRRQPALQPPVSGGASNMHDARKQLTLRMPQASQTMLQQADFTRGSLEDSQSPTGTVGRGAVQLLYGNLLCRSQPALQPCLCRATTFLRSVHERGALCMPQASQSDLHPRAPKRPCPDPIRDRMFLEQRPLCRETEAQRWISKYNKRHVDGPASSSATFEDDTPPMQPSVRLVTEAAVMTKSLELPGAAVKESRDLVSGDVYLTQHAPNGVTGAPGHTWLHLASHGKSPASAATCKANTTPVQPCARRVTEAEVMTACMQVLQGVLHNVHCALEPCTNLLVIGASSMHAAAIAAMLDAPLDVVYHGLTPRGIAKRLNTAMHAEAEAVHAEDESVHAEALEMRSETELVHAEAAEVHIETEAVHVQSLPLVIVTSQQPPDKFPRGTQPETAKLQHLLEPISAPTQARHEASQEASLACSQKAVHTGTRGAILQHADHQGMQSLVPRIAGVTATKSLFFKVVECTHTSMNSPNDCKSMLELFATASHGESLWVRVPAWYAPSQALAHAQSVAGQRPSFEDTSSASQGIGGASPKGDVSTRTPYRLTTMEACVDAPLIALEYSCADLASRCITHTPHSWVVACSHGGDVACMHVRVGVRCWTTTLGSSPDAGGQVTSNGRCVAIALLDGRVQLLQLCDGVLVSSYDTGGQLRRCVVYSALPQSYSVPC
jgi:hypothetical protein